MNVANEKCVNKLSIRAMKAAKTRNIVAILAIALTALLFTSLFTVALSINYSFQQANFRQVGGWAHGAFKYLSKEQFDEIKDHASIKEYGLRRFIGMPSGEPFQKSHVEIGYSDANQAHWMYCDPIEGELPTENSNEAATDLHVLELLGVEPVLGNEFTIRFDVDGTEVVETFVLSGWWEYDTAIVANHVLIPHSRVQSILDQVGVNEGNPTDGMTGTWNMDVMFGSSMNIERDITKILGDYGYQSESRSSGENYISVGVNWGYTGAQLSDSMDIGTLISIIMLLFIIAFTGYLIIYNVFQISVSNDIRFYGLIKTIGTTGRQIKHIIYRQALILSIIGIPIGLFSGYIIGILLTPIILSRLNGVEMDAISANPAIFIISAIFAFITILVSCRKPGRIAAKVSPIEAVRYSDSNTLKKTVRKSQSGASLFKMAWANIGRNRGKTIVTVASLSLAVLLLNITVTFTNGFDMDKYLSKFVSDFIIADASYFQVGNFWRKENAMPKETITMFEQIQGMEYGGRVYGKTSSIEEFVTEEYYRNFNSNWYDEERLDANISNMEKNYMGLLADRVQIYGMDRYILDKLTMIEGDLSKLYEPSGRYVAAVYTSDDYGKPNINSHWAKVGDIVTMRYVEEYEYYNIEGKIYEGSIPEDEAWSYRAKKYSEIEYEVAALVTIPYSLSYRYYGTDEFVMNSETFVVDSGTNDIMYYACDVEDFKISDVETFLQNYTNNQMTQLDYESKLTYETEFYSFRNMFLILGGVLSLVIGVVGVLNFLNSILTGIFTRRRELAMLQSIGMTGKQLKIMLVWEGLFYALGSTLVSLVLSLSTVPLLSNVFTTMFWFFTYRFTVWPIFLITPVFLFIGILIPLTVYYLVSKRSVVERLREVE